MSDEPGRPEPKPLLIWDGTCGFCRRWVERWSRATGDRVEYATFQEAAGAHPEIPESAFAEAVHLLEPGGRWSRGAEAVFRSQAYAPGGGILLWCYRKVPGFAAVTEHVYRFIARRRPAFAKLTDTIWGQHLIPPGERLTAWIFLRVLGVIYAIAFLSLWVQLAGLIGSQGILPAREFLGALADSSLGPVRFWYAPTLCWLGSSDLVLNGLCGAGVLASVALVVGLVPSAALIVAWVAYLSLATVCREFLWFQWDSLLLETGFLAIFLAPLALRSRPAADPPPERAPLRLLRWLLFRLLLSSAAVKLTSGDPSWKDLTALTVHFETQPLPTWTAWYVHHFPYVVLRAMTGATLVIEGLVPFLFFAPRRIRFAGALLVALLQTIIALTGNYGFFNLLTLALCLLLLDDGVWPEHWRGSLGAAPRWRWPAWFRRPVLVGIFLLSLVPLFGALRAPVLWLGPIGPVYARVTQFRFVNPYGLFAVMTQERPEIIVEGSDDGFVWRPYEFRWKAGDPKRRPGFVEPHMPRVDWQMWFAALGDYRRELWFLSFSDKLLQGSKPVLDLLAKNPFPRSPPRYIRAVVYDYRFTDASTREATGTWWRRELRALYAPVLTREQGRLIAAPPELQRL